MYNRYDGNTGRFVRIPEPEPPARRQQPALRNPPPPPERRPTYNPPPERSLILYLMYRESGDKELLIVLGAMLFL